MPYCTIEEARSQSLNPELNNDLNKDIGRFQLSKY